MVDARSRLSGQRVGGPAQERAKIDDFEPDLGSAPVGGGHIDQTGYGAVERPPERAGQWVAVNVALKSSHLTLVRSVHVLPFRCTRRFICNFSRHFVYRNPFDIHFGRWQSLGIGKSYSKENILIRLKGGANLNEFKVVLNY